jgi:hypothetical protein
MHVKGIRFLKQAKQFYQKTMISYAYIMQYAEKSPKCYTKRYAEKTTKIKMES